MSSAGAELDTRTPNPARVYDHLLRGGKDSLEALRADRETAAAAQAAFPPGVPGPRDLVVASRVYQQRAVSQAAHSRARQVLDLGAGLPVPRLHLPGVPPLRPLHEEAQAARPGARCAYVDCDQLAASHGSCAVRGIPGVTYVRADLADVGSVRDNQEVKAVIDWGQPVTVVLGLVLRFFDAAQAGRIVAGYLDGLRPGSRVVITSVWWDDPALLEKVRAACRPAPLRNHSADQIRDLLRGTQLLGNGVENAQGAPGLVGREVPAWVLGAVGLV